MCKLRWLVYLLCLTLVLPCLGGYASAGTVTDEPVALTWFFPIDDMWSKLMNDMNDLTYAQKAEEITGVHIEWQHPVVGQEAEQFNLLINSGDLPDILTHNESYYTYPGGGDKAIEDGAYLRLNELIEENAPNYHALINSTDSFRSETKTDEGNIWGFSMVESVRQGAWTGLVVRQDWLDQLGMEKPVTFDDWHTMLTRFKDELGAETPLLLPKSGVPWDNALVAGFGVGQEFYNENGVVKYGPVEPGYKDYVTTLAQWYREGLIDSEFVTRTDDSGAYQMYNNEAGAWHDGFYMLKQRGNLADSDTFHLVGIATPVRAEGETAHLRQSNNYVRGFATAVTTACENPALAVKYLDFNYSQEGYLLSNYGVEGETYTMVDGAPVFTDFMLHNPDGLNINEAVHKYCLHCGPMNRVWNRDAAGYTDDENACEQIWGAADDSFVMPPVTMTADEGTRYSALMNDIKTYVSEMLVKFITNTVSLDEYDAFVEQIRAMNITEATAIQQAAYDRFVAR